MQKRPHRIGTVPATFPDTIAERGDFPINNDTGTRPITAIAGGIPKDIDFCTQDSKQGLMDKLITRFVNFLRKNAD